MSNASSFFKERLALVVGGGGGIGRCVCLAFAKEGCRAILADMNFEEATVVAKSLADAEKSLGKEPAKDVMNEDNVDGKDDYGDVLQNDQPEEHHHAHHKKHEGHVIRIERRHRHEGRYRYTFTSSKDSWQRALRNKGKHERRKLPPQGEVLKNRQKFTAKNKTDVVPCCTTARVSRDVEPLDVGDSFEDEHSLCGHREWLRREMKKPIPDTEKVKDAMDRTFKSRRKYVCNDGPSVSALMEMYPALGDKDQILAEFFRITKVNVQEELHRVTDSHLQNILFLAQEKMKPFTLTVVLDALATADGAHRQGNHFYRSLQRDLTTSCGASTTNPRARARQSYDILRDLAQNTRSLSSRDTNKIRHLHPHMFHCDAMLPEHQHLRSRNWRAAIRHKTSRFESEVFRKLPQLPNQPLRGRDAYRAPVNTSHRPSTKSKGFPNSKQRPVRPYHPVKLASTVRVLVEDLLRSGLRINLSDTSLEPTRRINFYGFRLDKAIDIISHTPERFRALPRVLRSMECLLPLKALQRAAGYLAFRFSL
ncbi:hypothetical protein ISCGN_003124 [Ixodes scapularis]